MDKSSYDIVGDAVSKFWREKCFPMDVVCFFYQKYDYWQDDEWEWREEFASPVSDSDYDKVLFQNDFCEGQSVVKDLVIVPFDEVSGYYTKNVIAKDKKTMEWENNPHIQRIRTNSFFGLLKTEIDDKSHVEVTEQFDNIIKIYQTVEETQDNFIFNTIKPYCESVAETRISKRLLSRALYCFKTEHNAEYEYLIKESEEE